MHRTLKYTNFLVGVLIIFFFLKSINVQPTLFYAQAMKSILKFHVKRASIDDSTAVLMRVFSYLTINVFE